MNADTSPAPLWLRILQFPPIKLFLLGYPMFYCLGFSNAFLELSGGNHVLASFGVAGMVSLAMWIYIGFGRFIERREISDLALNPGLKELGIGMLVGSGLYTLGVLVLIVLGYGRIEGMNPVVVMIPALYQACSAGFLEELLFRGVLYRIVEEWLGSWVSVVVSSVVFGAVHLMNPDATLTGAIFISIEAGLLLPDSEFVNAEYTLRVNRGRSISSEVWPSTFVNAAISVWTVIKTGRPIVCRPTRKSGSTA